MDITFDEFDIKDTNSGPNALQPANINVDMFAESSKGINIMIFIHVMSSLTYSNEIPLRLPH